MTGGTPIYGNPHMSYVLYHMSYRWDTNGGLGSIDQHKDLGLNGHWIFGATLIVGWWLFHYFSLSFINVGKTTINHHPKSPEILWCYKPVLNVWFWHCFTHITEISVYVHAGGQSHGYAWFRALEVTYIPNHLLTSARPIPWGRSLMFMR